jgi:catechol 2,3-dioxygenase-like lactoylglutathione lyase family enzyme
MAGASPVDELRIALTVDDFDQAMMFYRDILGLHVDKEWHTPTGNGVVFAVERGTLEVVDVPEAESIDLVEVGRVVGERVRLAMRVRGVDEAQRAATGGGATLLGGPVVTPWGGNNARVRAPDGIQLTLFEESDED